MNIIVGIFGRNSFCFRPDTTWERENKDFFSPDFMRHIAASPVVFARVSRAGKCIGRKFAQRYYDGAGFGLLMYNGEALAEGGPDSIAFASMVDRSTVLPFPLYRPQAVANPENVFQVKVGEKEFFSTEGLKADIIGVLEDALCRASEVISVRTGDIIAMELSEPQGIISAETTERTTLEGSFCENELFKFDIIM